MKMMAHANGSLSFGSDPLGWLQTALSSPWVWVSLTAEVFTFVIWLEVLRRASLNFAFSTTSLGYITVSFASWLVFDEPIGWAEVAGVTLIIAGVYCMSDGDSMTKSKAPPMAGP